MHILQILEATGGGSRKHVLLITKALVQARHTVDLVLSPLRADPDFSDDLETYRGLGCRVELWEIPKLPGPGDWSLLRRLKALVRERRPDVIHSHCGKAGFLSRVLGKLLGRNSPAIVHTPHSYYFQGFVSPMKRCLAIRLERWLSRTGRLFCISQAETETIAKHRIAPATRVDVGRNGLPADFVDGLMPAAAARQELGLSEDVVAVGVFARYVARKGHKWLLRAIRAMDPALRAQTRFLFIGRGPEEERIKQRIETLELSDVVSCPGYRSHVDRLVAGIDIAVLPSYYEGLSYQLLEALAAGVPVVASDVPGNHLELPDNPIRYVPADDVLAMATALDELTGDGNARRDLGQAGREWSARHFSLADQLAKVLDSYNEACKTRD